MTRHGPLIVVGAAGYLGARVVQLADRPVVAVTRHAGPGSIDFAQLLENLATDNTTAKTVIWLLAGARHDEHQHMLRLLEAAATRPLRLIYVSSCAVYGTSTQPVDEDGALNPQDAYAREKAACETLVDDSCHPGVVLRLATLHGHDHAGETKQSVHKLIHHAAAGKVDLYGADNWRPFLHLDTAAAAVLAAAADPAVTGTFNIAHDHATFGDVGLYAAALFDAETVTVDQPDTRSYLVDTGRATDAGLLQPAPDPQLWKSMDNYAADLRAQRR